MNCLVVTTHPLAASLCKHLTEHVVASLRSMNHTVALEDLYAGKFEPAMTGPERESYYSGSYDFSKIQEQVVRLEEAEALVLVFPTWWFGFPAMLKGWFDRVWGPGIAYDHASDYGPIKPRLHNLRKVLVVTTLGASWWIDRLVMRQPIKRVIKIALLHACARNSELKYLSLYDSEKVTLEKTVKFKRRIDQALSDWQ